MNPESAEVVTEIASRRRARRLNPQDDHILELQRLQPAEMSLYSDITDDKHKIQTTDREVAMKPQMTFFASLVLGVGVGLLLAETQWNASASKNTTHEVVQSAQTVGSALDFRIVATQIAASQPVSTGVSATAQSPKPNIVFMMVDNLGWGELGCYGGGVLRGAETPRLDKLAREGMRLLNFNVENQCTPSRSALMTGRHPIRSGTTRVVWGQLYGLTAWEKTWSELLSEAGYSTGMFGKWHLGDTPGRFPTDQGFDEWFGVANTTDESWYRKQFKFDRKARHNPRKHPFIS